MNSIVENAEIYMNLAERYLKEEFERLTDR